MYSEAVVRLYDLEHRDFDADLDMYLSYARTKGGPILELGCGTGRVLSPLLAAGYHVTGVDSAESMLARARQKLSADFGARLTLVQTDLRELAGVPDETYALAFCALNTWSHLYDPTGALAALRAAHRVLLPAGLLILDLEDAEFKQPGRGELLLAGTFHDADRIVTKMVATILDARTGVEDVTIIWDEVSEGTLQRTVAQTRMRPYRRWELEQLLERAGFEVRDVFGSWALDEYAAQGDRLIFVASRV